VVLLDLFCGAGGAAMGYSRAGFEIVGVDVQPQMHYPFEFHQADAMEFLFKYGKEFDVIHASPPCQKYTGLNSVNLFRRGSVPLHPDLISLVRRSLIGAGRPWLIENVKNSPLLTGIILCGASMGLRNVQRHRHFESSMLLFAPKCVHRKESVIYGVYGRLNG